MVSYVQLLSGLESLAVIIASGVAIWGINAWKREHGGGRRIELAEETLTLFYEARDVINGARSLLGFEHEYRTAEKLQRDASGADSGPQEVRIVAYRLHQRTELFARIRALRYRFAAVFGEGAEQPFRDLAQLVTRIVVAERHLPELQRRYSQSTGEAKGTLDARLQEQADIVEAGGDDSDPTTQKLNAIVQEIERICRSVLE
jgi:hypothetical protein